MSGFGAHYKGDVSEATMGHETGLFIEHGVGPRTWSAIYDATNPDYTQIEFRNISNMDTSSGTLYQDSSIFERILPILKVPLGMLIGQKLSFHQTSASGNFSSFYYSALKSRVYTIVDHLVQNNTDGTPALSTVIRITPALRGLGASTHSAAGDAMYIHGTGLPTVQGDTNSAMTAAASGSKEVSLIDQFVGLASFMTLPDTKVDLHSYHVVGLGRQVAVQQTGKVHHMGGSLEMPLHSPKWLYYSLGREVVSKDKCGTLAHLVGSGQAPTIYANIEPGQGYIDLASAQAASLRFGSSGTHDAEVGEYILIKDATRIPTTTYNGPKAVSVAVFLLFSIGKI